MDARIFHFINTTCSNPFFDTFFVWFTDFQKSPEFHFIGLPVILIATFWFFRWRGLALLATASLLTWGADVLGNYVIKQLFNRPRPFETLNDVIVRIPRPGSSSFPSGHTLDAFFFATFLALIYPRLSWLYFAVACLIGVSRIYLGVHYPSDALGGAVFGSAIAYSVVTLYRLAREGKIHLKFLFLILLIASPSLALAVDDPTGGKAVFPWIWNDQFEPTLKHSLDLGGIGVLAGGAAGSIVSHQYDYDVQEADARKPFMDSGTSGFLGTLGGGGLGIGITALQLFVDQKNGLKHGRAIALTAVSHVTLALIARRERPPGRDDYLPFKSSWPSGHASSAFATAESLAYAYGWWVGVPANAVAIAIAAGRVSENAHWLSDVVAGAALGIFWAHASNNVDEIEPAKASWHLVPVPLEDGLQLSLTKRF